MGGDVKDAVGGNRRRVDGGAKTNLVNQLLFLAGGEDGHFAVNIAEIDFAVGNVRRTHGEYAFGVVRPVDFAGVSVETVNRAGHVGDKDNAVGDRGRGKTAV